MIRTVWLVVVACWTLAGCVTEPLKATWYYVEEDEDYSGLFVAVLNQSEHTLTIEGIAFNSKTGAKDEGWTWNAPDDGQRLDPGQLLIIKVDDPKAVQRDWPICQIPIRLVIKRSPPSARPLTIQLSSMPSALPRPWVTSKCLAGSPQASTAP